MRGAGGNLKTDRVPKGVARTVKKTFGTDRQLRALKPAAAWYDVYDEEQRGLAVRVGPKDSKGKFRRTFVLVARFNGAHPTRRRIGEYPGVSLLEAREKAGDWRKLVKKGKDPQREEERGRRGGVCARTGPRSDL